MRLLTAALALVAGRASAAAAGRASTAAPRGAYALLAATAGAATWAPADECRLLNGAETCGGSSVEARTRAVDAELLRSIERFPARQKVSEVRQLVKDMLRDEKIRFHPPLRTKAVFVLFGRVFMHHHALAQDKWRSLAATLASAERHGVPLPNCAFIHNEQAHGGAYGKCMREDLGVPMTAIAKRTGYAACGVLVPNPYFGATRSTHPGDLATWHKQAAALRAQGHSRPAASRIPRVMWRGKCLNHEHYAEGAAHNYTLAQMRHDAKNNEKWNRRRLRHLGPGECLPGWDEFGNRARMLAASLTTARPDRFDVKCAVLDVPRNFSCVDDAARRLELAAARDAVLAAPKAVEDTHWIRHEDYSRFKYLVNLPGETTGSYSRNLNHLWTTGAAILLWDAPFVEWYYPALTVGTTHTVVDRASAEAVVDDLESDSAAYAALARGAAIVDAELVCASCIADYWRRVLEAIRRRMRYDLLLDDPGRLRVLFQEVGACDDIVEIRAIPGRHSDVFTGIEIGPSVCDVMKRLRDWSYNRAEPPAT